MTRPRSAQHALSYILVVENDVDTAEAVADAVRSEDYEVELAYNGEQGLRCVEKRVPDLLLLDVEMPVLSGPELAKHLLRAGYHVPIVLLSGSAELPRVAKEIGTPYFRLS